MDRTRGAKAPQVTENDWVTFPGGELEGERPKVLCRTCRERLRRQAAGLSGASADVGRPLCFQCYRAGLERDRAIKAAGELHTATEARFQSTLPFEPVNRPRLERLRTARADARVVARVGAGKYVDKRRQAQIAARHALQQIAEGLRARAARAPIDRTVPGNVTFPYRSAEWDAIRAAELQLPDAWLPFVVSR